MSGPGSSGGAKRGRPKKNEEYDREEHIQALLDDAVRLFAVPYDDRDERPADAPSISQVAEQMHTSRMRVRKLLITAEMYSTAQCRTVQALYGQGLSVREICDETGLGRSAVHSCLPYCRGTYKLDDASPAAEQCRVYRLRKEAVEALQAEPGEHRLWTAVAAFAGYRFRLDNGKYVSYSVSGDAVSFGDAVYSREEVLRQYRGSFADADELLKTVFLRIGACKSE